LNDKFFRVLKPSEEVSFREWARDNYVPLSPIKKTWHPVVKMECELINQEHGWVGIPEE
jgi:hypothetical protein